MKIGSKQIIKSGIFQLLIYLFVNSLFILKYFSRFGANQLFVLTLYILFIISFTYSYQRYSFRLSPKVLRNGFFILTGVMIVIISTILLLVHPLSIHVDRWSALTYFWDFMLHGKYPYSAHTHVSLTNYPSPFPFWQLVNFPFYLMGDVGIGLIIFLLITAFFVQKYFDSYRRVLLFFILLFLSPAYWWEVMVRSDSLNNAWFVFLVILWVEKSGKKLNTNFLLLSAISGAITATRLTAIIPLAIYLFHQYVSSTSVRQKIFFPVLTLLISFLFFAPFIFWDTQHWIFFDRNPFMSQADKGYPAILLISIIIGIFMSMKWRSFEQFYSYTAAFIFIFISMSQFGLYIRSNFSSDFLFGNICDISYFNLCLPYCLAALSIRDSDKFKQSDNESQTKIL